MILLSKNETQIRKISFAQIGTSLVGCGLIRSICPKDFWFKKKGDQERSPFRILKEI
jgi:hypothetical protein